MAISLWPLAISKSSLHVLSVLCFLAVKKFKRKGREGKQSAQSLEVSVSRQFPQLAAKGHGQLALSF